MIAILFLSFLLSCTCAEDVRFLDGPLFTGSTTFVVSTITSTLVKPSPCYFTTGKSVSGCRWKRGIKEEPFIVEPVIESDIAPSPVFVIEATPVPRAINPRYESEIVYSSKDDSYQNSIMVFGKLMANIRKNVITVGDCGGSVVNFSQFLSCLGLTVQETTTLTATFIVTTTTTSGFKTISVGGCFPDDFPFYSCPSDPSR